MRPGEARLHRSTLSPFSTSTWSRYTDYFHMRLFTAVDIPDEVKDALGKTIERLRPTGQAPVDPREKLHITTKFIGEWPETRMRRDDGGAERCRLARRDPN